MASNQEEQRKKQEEIDNKRAKSDKSKEEQRVRLEAKIDVLTKEFNQISKKLEQDKSSSETTKDFLEAIRSKLADVQEQLAGLSQKSNVYIQDSSNVSNFKVVSRESNIYINDSSVAYLDVYDPESFREISAEARTIALESSLPRNTALQPGSTAVYTAVLYVERSLIFTPSQYRLQFNINYSFHAKKPNFSKEAEEGEEGIYTNTVAHEISIRPSVYSVIIGSGLGGLTGSIARLLQVTPTEKWETFSSTDISTSFIAIAVAVILSGVAVVFMARKSEAQSFVSVEDFWGGLLIGFLVGYTGTSFFEQLTGFTNPTTANPAPIVSPNP